MSFHCDEEEKRRQSSKQCLAVILFFSFAPIGSVIEFQYASNRKSIRFTTSIPAMPSP